MKGQGKRRSSVLVTGLVVLLLALGLGTGLIAVIVDTPSLWRIADLFFDFALLATMVSRGPALLSG
jgi:hypothetical protein